MNAHLNEEKLNSLLKLPNQKDQKIRVVLDTDFNNEIDDFFALTWLLLQRDKIEIEGIYAAPFSFRHRLMELLQAYSLMNSGYDNLTSTEKDLIATYKGQIKAIEGLGIDPVSLADPGQHVALTPGEGMETSYIELLEFTQLFGEINIPILRGADRYTENGCPVRSDAVQHLINLARDNSSGEPIYVIGLACATNLASALLLAPDIKDKVVFVWTAGYPTNVTSLKNGSFNLEQDLFASQVLFSSGVPLVYIPGFYIGQQLTLSQADMEAWFRPSGAIGEALYSRYMNNPLFTWYGINPENLFGRVWTIWDAICIAWMVNPEAVPSHCVQSPILNDDAYWVSQANSHLIRECYAADYNGVFPLFAEQLRSFTSEQ